MSITDKQARLKELSKPNIILSDQEYEEKERLEDELNMIHQEETRTFKETNIDLGQGKGELVQVKNQKKSILDIILQKIKKKPATWDEIQQLKLERLKAIYKRDIAVANYHRKNPGGKPKKQYKSKSSLKNSDIDKTFNSSARDFQSMIGKNDKNKYKGLI